MSEVSFGIVRNCLREQSEVYVANVVDDAQLTRAEMMAREAQALPRLKHGDRGDRPA